MTRGTPMSQEDILSDNSNPFDSGNSAKSLSFASRDAYGNLSHLPVGTRYDFEVTEEPKEVQARDFDSGQPAFWDKEKTQPKKTIVIGVKVNGEDRTLWAPKPSATFTAIKEALTTAQGVQPIKVGGKGFIEFTGYGKAEAGKNPQKLFKVGYTAPNAFADPTNTTAPASGATQTASGVAADQIDADLAKAKAEKIASLTPEDRLLLGYGN